MSFPVLLQDLGMQFATPSSKQKKRVGIYKCKCGNTFKSMTHHIKSGSTKSCGCINKMKMSEMSKKHGLYNHKLYLYWKNMIKRCNNPKNPQYKHYGGRGITFLKDKNKWHSQICVSYKKIHLGSFDNPIDAAKAYDRYVIDNNLEHTTNGLM